MIGCGSMGGGLALLFAENGIHVSLSDPSEENMDSVIDRAEKDGYQGRVTKFKGELPTSSRLVRIIC
jgi:6-phosphogluconate dehydrogenase